MSMAVAILGSMAAALEAATADAMASFPPPKATVLKALRVRCRARFTMAAVQAAGVGPLMPCTMRSRMALGGRMVSQLKPRAVECMRRNSSLFTAATRGVGAPQRARVEARVSAGRPCSSLRTLPWARV